MRPESESRPWRTTVGLVSAGILFASLVWGTIAIGDESIKAQRLDIGAPVTVDALLGSRGQGLNAQAMPPPSDVDIISVILWDESQRSPAPPAGPNATGLSSTVNGAAY